MWFAFGTGLVCGAFVVGGVVGIGGHAESISRGRERMTRHDWSFMVGYQRCKTSILYVGDTLRGG